MNFSIGTTCSHDIVDSHTQQLLSILAALSGCITPHSWFREKFCEPSETANTLCAVPLGINETEWCLDEYNSTRYVAPHVVGKHLDPTVAYPCQCSSPLVVLRFGTVLKR